MHEANGHGANIRFISDNMHSSTGHRLGGYTFEACISGRFRIVEGSSRSRVVGEVVVHGGGGSCLGSWRVVVEGLAASRGVVVHLSCRMHDNGSGTWRLRFKYRVGRASVQAFFELGAITM